MSWFRLLIPEMLSNTPLGRKISLPPSIVNIYSSALMNIETKDHMNLPTKHIYVRFNKRRNCTKRRSIHLVVVKYALQVAEILSKPVALRELLKVIPLVISNTT